MNTEVAQDKGEDVINKISLEYIINTVLTIFSTSTILFGILLTISIYNSSVYDKGVLFLTIIILISGIYSTKFSYKDLIKMAQFKNIFNNVFQLLIWGTGISIGVVVFLTIIISIIDWIFNVKVLFSIKPDFT